MDFNVYMFSCYTCESTVYLACCCESRPLEPSDFGLFDDLLSPGTQGWTRLMTDARHKNTLVRSLSCACMQVGDMDM
jgi:hypothetical protein